MTPGRKGRFLGAVAAAATMIAIVAVVHATIPDSGGVIHGCYLNNSGTLRVVDDPSTCKNNETAMAWSQTGPQGQQGPQGPQGPPGPAGQNAASHLFAKTETTDPIPGDNLGHVVTRLTGLPAGHYLIQANIEVSFDSCFFCIGPAVADCYFDGAVSAFPVTQQGFANDDRAQMPLAAAVTLPGDNSTVRVICTTYDRDANWIAADMFASQVNALN
jgi:hypothetical protein